jgi:regulator of sigma E protease
MLTGQLSADNLTGPVGMAEYAGKAAEVGLTAYLSYLALISVSLFVLNLLPLPLLDGGHLLYYLLEVVRGRALSASTTMWLQRLGLSLIVLLSVFTLFNDLARLGW